ncbi:hypothetical protein NADFUDRAFT_83944 [Nadsonia fulvescens var. elongata DSM 6958]|uniref:Nudix hydrolase domain-containing protein n=1 Tax=Nadsonia fulvescens var. elongata DSM 6958 TaxID=857566 RepID=A0A1E3PEK4_9ASCO|nr:hypothetical protein NADFUDRAFT_83944 [Nadsonia fulvescens var. elongata DSM 6958]
MIYQTRIPWTRFLPRLGRGARGIRINPLDFTPSRIVNIRPLPLESARWVTLQEIEYIDANQTKRRYERAKRIHSNTSPAPAPALAPALAPVPAPDAVAIIALVHHPDPRHRPVEIILQKQFRPALGKVCIELPAGLVNSSTDTSPSNTARRELAEETGIFETVTVKRAEAIAYNDPGLSDASVVLVHLDVDESGLTHRKNVALDEAELVESFTVPVADLENQLNSLRARGMAIDTRLVSLVAGMQLWKEFGTKLSL